MDKLKLSIRATDMVKTTIQKRNDTKKFSLSSFQLLTDIRELYDVINRMNIVPNNYIGRSKLSAW